MKVADLKRVIEELPDDMEVVMAKDMEGNDFKNADDASTHYVFVPESSWNGDVYDTYLTADDAGMEEDEWEDLKRKPRCLLLWPVN